jgi:hypothetical protein
VNRVADGRVSDPPALTGTSRADALFVGVPDPAPVTGGAD